MSGSEEDAKDVPEQGANEEEDDDSDGEIERAYPADEENEEKDVNFADIWAEIAEEKGVNTGKRETEMKQREEKNPDGNESVGQAPEQKKSTAQKQKKRGPACDCTRCWQHAWAFVWLFVKFCGAAVLGTLLRTQLIRISIELGEHEQNSVLQALTHPFLLPNIVGCFLMGMYMSWPDPHTVNQVSLTTGFAGSLTTFSSMNVVANSEILDGAVSNFCAILLVTVSLCFHAYDIGRILLPAPNSVKVRSHHRMAKMEKAPHKHKKPPVLPRYFIARVITIALMLATILMFVIDRHNVDCVLASLVLTPVGALVRFWLGHLLNDYSDRASRRDVPFVRLLHTVDGTLLANIIGTVIGAWVAHESDNWLIAVGVGLAGSTSTVSSWIMEMHRLRDKHRNVRGALQYGLLSIVLAQAAATVVYLFRYRV